MNFTDKPKNSGFTIIELMIATVVFSTILLIITGGIVQIGKAYYKGVISARTQNTTRQLTDEVTRNLQFNRGKFVSSGIWRCVGGTHYKLIALAETGFTLERYATSGDTACGSALGTGTQ